MPSPYEQPTWKQTGHDLFRVGFKTAGVDLLILSAHLNPTDNFDKMSIFAITTSLLNLGLSKLSEHTHIDPSVPGLSEAESILLLTNSLAIPMIINLPLDVATKTIALVGLAVANYQWLYSLNAHHRLHHDHPDRPE